MGCRSAISNPLHSPNSHQGLPMAIRGTGPIHRALVVAGLIVLAGLGCGKKSGGLSDFDKLEMEKQDKTKSLAEAGVKMSEKQYAIGRGWVVDMTGATVT